MTHAIALHDATIADQLIRLWQRHAARNGCPHAAIALTAHGLAGAIRLAVGVARAPGRLLDFNIGVSRFHRAGGLAVAARVGLACAVGGFSDGSALRKHRQKQQRHNETRCAAATNAMHPHSRFLPSELAAAD
jgi:hypothetical protein